MNTGTAIRINRIQKTITSRKTALASDLKNPWKSSTMRITIKDIFDRLIIATARCLEAPIVACDERIKSAGVVQVVWE